MSNTPKLDAICEKMPRFIDGPAATLYQFAGILEMNNAKLRAALENAHSFIQAVGTEDPDDVETMADIERLSGKITATLAETI